MEDEPLYSQMRHRLPKGERLYLREEIERLHTRGGSFVVYPIRIVWLAEPLCDTTKGEQAQVAVMTSVAKRRFKHAVERNRIKRMTRSAYRLQKALLWQLATDQQLTIRVAFQSVAKEMPTYHSVERAVERAIARIVKEIKRSGNAPHSAKVEEPQSATSAPTEEPPHTAQASAPLSDEPESSSLGVRLLSFPIQLYRRLISPLFPPSCRFTPTCSQYALEALRTHGALKGSWLTLWRLLRCNPFNKHVGYDPVPPKLCK